MKLIEAMKLCKELARKSEDLVKKVADHCADMDFETPLYPDQKRQVSEWIQAHSDIQREVLNLRLAIQATNLATMVTIKLGDVQVTKSISAWIHRRRDLAGKELGMWMALGDRGLREGQFLPASNPGGSPTAVKIRRYYDPAERDRKVELFRSEPLLIDSTLEVVNAVTDLIV